MRRRVKRRGFTLIVMMLMMTVFIGSAAFATDFAKMYLIRGQLQAAADAGALSGIYLAAQGWKDSTVDSARAYTFRHKILRSAYDSSTAAVAPGNWKDTFACTPAGSCLGFVGNGNNWNDPALDAVRVIVNYTGTYGFGRFFGFNTRVLYDTAVAIRGNATSSTCIRPFAIPYQALLNVLYPTPPLKDPFTYNLTTADINTLRAMGVGASFPLKVGTAGDLTPNGEFYAAQMPPGQYADGSAGNPWSGGSDYRTAIGSTCTQLQALLTATGSSRGASISIGDYLEPESGNKVGPTRQGINDLCGSDTCSPPIKIAAALWDGIFDVTHCSGCYRIKYIGAFAVTGWDQPSKSVTGYFTSMAVQGGSGGAGGPPGPAQFTGLRK
jgi:hypothetical protein